MGAGILGFRPSGTRRPLVCLSQIHAPERASSTWYPPAHFLPDAFYRRPDLFKHAFARAFPEKASQMILRLLGSHSGRKTLALWLWVQQRDKRLLQDAAHWSVAMEGAIASCYATPWRTIVHAVMALEDRGSLHIFPELI